MAITVDSSQWTGERDDTPLPVPVVWGEFESEAARDNALARLKAAGARDSGASHATSGAVVTPEHAANEDQVQPPDLDSEHADLRNQRELEVGTAMAMASMAAAGLVIATGGGALPALAAAAAAGAATAVVGEPLATAIALQSQSAHSHPGKPPRADGPVVGLLAPDDETRARAATALREAGARRILVQETTAG
ncbi:hypothetical protein [Falsiroseomonas sp.]|uniref:hypothetical protein n=1 Tax=Falsiroseomonas sp. TaxID=2870721 RepID=UPI0034A5506B